MDPMTFVYLMSGGQTALAVVLACILIRDYRKEGGTSR